MSFDLSWFWNWLQGVVDTIASWFNSLWGVAQQITNTGQGLFAGLATVASGLWDSLRWLADQIYGGLKWFYDGLVSIGEALKGFGEWIWNALAGIPSAIYGFGQWLWNGLLWVANVVGQALANVWNAIVEGIEWLWNQLVNAYNAFVEGINTWWTNTIVWFRQKLKQTIMADLTIFMSWKGAEKALERGDWKAIMILPVGALAGAFAGAVFAEIVDAMIPTPSTTVFQLVPSMTLPSISLPRVTAPYVPTPAVPAAPEVPAIGYGLPYDIILDLGLNIVIDTSTESSDTTLNIPSTVVETEIT